MDEFELIAQETVNEEFARLTKATESMTPEAQREYAEKFGIRIWAVAGVSEDHALAFSAN